MATLSPAERSYIITGLAHPDTPTRVDGRALLAPRGIEVSYGESPAANGSARVRVGGTEVIAGVKLEVAAVGPEGSSDAWRGKIDVDITPQAFPTAGSQDLQKLSSQYAALLTEHLLPSIPYDSLRITPTRAFAPNIHLAVLAADGASIPNALALAARAALADLAVPKTKAIGWEESQDATTAKGESAMAGIKGAIGVKKGQSKAKARGADDWDLDTSSAGPDGAVTRLKGREELPVLVTLHLVPGSGAVFLDATAQEEAACPGKILAFFRPTGRICGLRMEGDEALDSARIQPLLEQAQSIAKDLASSLNADMPTEF